MKKADEGTGENGESKQPPLPVVLKGRDLARFTGKRISPKQHRAILNALVLGEESIVSIARRLHCSPSTIMAIREREADKIGSWKSLTSRKLGQFITMATERMADEVESFSVAQLPVAVGILIDKKAILDGELSMQIGYRPEKPTTMTDVADYLKSLTSPQVIDLPPAANG